MGIVLAAVTGETVQTVGGGGVSQRLPDRLLPPGGVPITN